jgi:hypothetical protein
VHFGFGIILTSFIVFSFVGGTVGVVYPSAIDYQISNPYACIYVFILMLQNAYLCPLNCGIPFLYKFFSLHDLPLSG